MKSRVFAVFALVASSLFAQVEREGSLPAPLPLFPPSNPWNLDITAAPVDTNSTNFINFIGATTPLHPDFGGDAPASPEIYGFVYITVPGSQPLEQVTFVASPAESDNGAPGRPAGYPIPVEARSGTKWIEGGFAADDPTASGDRHMLIVDRDHHLLFELYHAHFNGVNWEAGSGSVFRLDTNERRPETWTSADASGMAMLPGLIRYDEVFGPDPIRHALRFTVDFTNGYVFPASHDASASTSPNALPLGARLRLKAATDISTFAPEVQKIFQAMKTYGLIVTDNGSDMYISGTYDTRWNNDVLNPAFGSLHASDFDVIQRGWQPARPSCAHADFNIDDRTDLVLRNYTTGQNALWLMNDMTLWSIIDLPALPNTAYRFEGTADFDHDGKTDLLIRNQSTGQNAIWKMDGPQVVGIVDLPALPNTNFHFEGTEHLDGNGTKDVLLRNYVTGQDAVWLMNGMTFIGIVDLPALPNTDYRIEGAGDFDGDGNDDLVWRNYATGQNAVWLMNGTSLKSVLDLPALTNTNYRFDGVGDLSGDCKPDIVLRNYATGQNALWRMNGTALGGIVDLPALPNTSYEIAGPR